MHKTPRADLDVRPEAGLTHKRPNGHGERRKRRVSESRSGINPAGQGCPTPSVPNLLLARRLSCTRNADT